MRGFLSHYSQGEAVRVRLKGGTGTVHGVKLRLHGLKRSNRACCRMVLLADAEIVATPPDPQGKMIWSCLHTERKRKWEKGEQVSERGE